MMLSLIVISIILFVARAQNYCVYGRGGVNSGINGLYTVDTINTYNDKATYVQTVGAGCTTYYIYYVSGSIQWRIASAIPGTSGWNAYCSQADLSSCTAGNWYVANGGFAVDSNVYITVDACPEWNCDAVSTNLPAMFGYDLCGGFELTKDSSNTNSWVDSTGDRYLFYHAQLGEWVCASSYNDGCSVSGYAFTDDYQWTELTAGTYDEMTWKYMSDTTYGLDNTGTYRINCIDSSGQASAANEVSSSISATTSSATGDSWCIWNRFDSIGTNVALNGLYSYDGLQNGYASYKKTACGDTFYLWKSSYGSKWYIGTTKGSNTYSAICNYDTLQECYAGRWYTAGSYDANMYAVIDSCPQWDCASITSTVSGNCASFDTQMAANTWKNDAGYYWHFLPEMWMWRCTNSATVDYGDCSASYYAASDRSTWIDLSAGESASITYSFPSADYTVTCTGTGSFVN